jgi:hypothetical protein
MMRGRTIGSLVVADNGEAMGIVTVSDLLELIGRGGARNNGAKARPVLQHRVPHRKRHTSAGPW